MLIMTTHAFRTGSNKPLYKLLWSAGSAERTEWFFNNIRMRSRMSRARLALLPSGTSSNEALHAEINNWFRQTQQIHGATLHLKLQVLTLGKMLAHSSAMYHATARQMPVNVVLAGAISRNVWTPESWHQWCCDLAGGTALRKASLELQVEKEGEIQIVRQWVLKRPAAAPHEPSGIKRRTPFTRPRGDNLLTGGVKNTVYRRPACAV